MRSTVYTLPSLAHTIEASSMDREHAKKQLDRQTSNMVRNGWDCAGGITIKEYLVDNGFLRRPKVVFTFTRQMIVSNKEREYTEKLG